MSTSGHRADTREVDTREMVLIHCVIRREIGQLPRLFRSAEQATPSRTLGS